MATKKAATLRGKYDPRGFYLIRIHERSGVEEPEDVFLSVNSSSVSMQRGRAVPLPGTYVLALDQARVAMFTQKLGESRKRVGERRRFPFDVLRETTPDEHAEYLERIAAGITLPEDAEYEAAQEMAV